VEVKMVEDEEVGDRGLPVKKEDEARKPATTTYVKLE